MNAPANTNTPMTLREQLAASVQLLSVGYVTTPVRQLDERFHDLIAKDIAGTITAAETAELDLMCAVKEQQR